MGAQFPDDRPLDAVEYAIDEGDPDHAAPGFGPSRQTDGVDPPCGAHVPRLRLSWC